MKVYGSVRKYTAFHSKPGCPALKRAYETQELDEVGSREPCTLCYPAIPKLRVRHARCRRCGQQKPAPCPHNGGVMVMAPTWYGKRRLRVWPEVAYKYELAPTATPV